MSVGRSTGLTYDNWLSQHPTWDVDDIRHEPPLLRHEAIVCAMQEKFFARSFTTSQGQPPDTGINFRDIASHGYLLDQALFDDVADINIDLLDVWANYTDNNGSWDGQAVCAPAWDETSMSLDIDPFGSGSLQRPTVGDLYTAEYIREQYDILNRQIWYLEALSNVISFQDGPDRFDGSTGTPNLIWLYGNGDSSGAIKWLHVGSRWEGYLDNDFLGEVSNVFAANTINAVPDPNFQQSTVSLTTNDTGSFFVNKRDGVGVGRVVLGFGFTKEYDCYMFATPPIFNHNAATTDDYDSPLNGTFDTLGAFIDHSSLGINNNLWTYVADTSGLKLGTDDSADGSGTGGWQVRIPQSASLSSIIHDPVTAFGAANTAFNDLPGIMVVRLDLVGGLEFVDPLINPSSGLSLPPPIFTDIPIEP